MDLLQQLLPFDLTDADMLALSVGAGIGLSFFMFLVGLMENDTLPKRISLLSERRRVLQDELINGNPRHKPRSKQLDFAEQVVEQFKLLKSSKAEEAREKLQKAGYRSKESLTIYLFAKLVLPIAAALGGLIAFQVFQFANVGKNMATALSVGAVILGAFAPDIYVKNMVQRRLKVIQKGLPDSYDLMVICAEAGLSIDAALQRVSQEMSQGAPELADELSLTAIELSFLPDRTKALYNFTDRVPLPGVVGLVNTLMQTERYGTPLAQSLRVLSAELRNERMMKAEEKAARLPAIMTVPMVTFILPPLMMVLLGPAGIKTVDALSSVF